MRYRFDEKDCRRIESWARKSKLHTILTFIESHPPDLEFPRAVFLGTSNGADVLIEGLATRHTVSSTILELDEPFDKRTVMVRKQVFKKQQQDLSAEIHGTIASGLANGFEKLCFLDSSGCCDQTIVRAHAIQEALLRQIAVNGHVLQFNLFDPRTPKDGFRNWPKKVGVDRVGTFTGFCGYHDHQVFRVIEEGEFTPTPEGLFLYGYRSLCSTLYTSRYKFELVKSVRQAVAASQRLENDNISRDIAANELNVKEQLDLKSSWDKARSAGDYGAFDHLVLTCPQTPDIVGTLFFAPSKGFDYKLVQWKRGRSTLEWIAFTVVPCRGGGGAVMISGVKGGSVWCRFVDSLIGYPPDKRTMAVVNYLIPIFGEQLILSPAWWDGLPVVAQEAVVNAWAAGYYPRYLTLLR